MTADTPPAAEPLPCPLCGGPARAGISLDGDAFVECEACELVLFNRALLSEALADWNRRAGMESQASEVERLRAEAHRFYHADGTFEVLDSPEAVIERRKAAAVEIERLKAERDGLQSALWRAWHEIHRHRGLSDHVASVYADAKVADILKAIREANTPPAPPPTPDGLEEPQ